MEELIDTDEIMETWDEVVNKVMLYKDDELLGLMVYHSYNIFKEDLKKRDYDKYQQLDKEAIKILKDHTDMFEDYE